MISMSLLWHQNNSQGVRKHLPHVQKDPMFESMYCTILCHYKLQFRHILSFIYNTCCRIAALYCILFLGVPKEKSSH